MLKWPNDVMLLGRKLGGILLERSDSRVIVGFGVNLAEAPPLSDRRTASLGAAMAPQAFAPLLSDAFQRLLRLWRQNDARLIAQAWLARAHPIGTQLTVHANAEESISGRFDGLEADGALRLRRHDGALEMVRAGDVEL